METKKQEHSIIFFCPYCGGDAIVEEAVDYRCEMCCQGFEVNWKGVRT